MEPKQKLCYSKKVVMRLIEQGYFPVKEIPHPTIDGYKCWLFEYSEDFMKVFLKAVEEVKSHG